MQLPGNSPGTDPGPQLTVEERQTLLALARNAVRAAIAGNPSPRLSPEAMTAGVAAPRACFVTLRLAGELQGCMGQLKADEPLWEAVVKNAGRAAITDRRFNPVTADKVDRLTVEISVLTPPLPLEYETTDRLLEQLRPGKDGVVLRIGDTVSTFLPQVWEDLPDKEQFMDQLARKGGHEKQAWRAGLVSVAVYEVDHFEGL